MTYETITVDQLPNRKYTSEEHSFRDFTGQYPEKPIAERTFVILHRQSKGWWNIFETTNEQVALAELAKKQQQDALMVATLAQSKKAEIRAQAVPAEFKIVVVEPERLVIEVPVEAVEEVQEVVEQSVEVSNEASTTKDQSSHHLDWNQQTQRYEGLVGGKRLCVEVEAFTKETDWMQKAAPTDDEYRIWGVATWVRTWIDRAGSNPHVYFEEVNSGV